MVPCIVVMAVVLVVVMVVVVVWPLTLEFNMVTWLFLKRPSDMRVDIKGTTFLDQEAPCC